MKKVLSFLLVSVLGVTMFATNAKADYKVDFKCGECKLASDGNCEETCTLGLTGNTNTISSFKGTLILEPADKLTLKDVKLSDGWSSVSGSTTSTEINIINPAGVSTSTVNLATFTISKPQDLGNDSCKISFKPENMEVIEQPVKTEKQPSTGVSLPLVILGCGAVVAIGAYYVTKKSTKMYKI